MQGCEPYVLYVGKCKNHNTIEWVKAQARLDKELETMGKREESESGKVELESTS